MLALVVFAASCSTTDDVASQPRSERLQTEFSGLLASDPAAIVPRLARLSLENGYPQEMGPISDWYA